MKKNYYIQTFCFYQHNRGMRGVDLLGRFDSQYRPTKHCCTSLRFSALAKITALKLHATAECSRNGIYLSLHGQLTAK